MAKEVSVAFDIPAGPAAQTLVEFSKRATRPVVFATHELEGVTTNAIAGRYTDIEALRRLLAGTGLMPVEDYQTGRITLQVAPGTEVVELPPYTVSEVYKEPSWSYAQVGNLKVLSRCSDLTTQMLIEHHVRLRQMLAALLPAELQAHYDVPGTYVLYNESNQPGIARDVLDSFAADKDEGRVRLVQGLTNYRFCDRDVEVTLCILNEQAFERSRMSLTLDYVRDVMLMRTPALPSWFVESMQAIYMATKLESEPLRNPPHYGWGRIVPTPIAIGPLRWRSESATEAIRKNARAKVEMLPWAQVFDSSPAVDGSVEQTALRQAQAELFVRWAIDTKEKTNRRDELVNFVSRISAGERGEAVFQSCFGLTYAETDQALRHYLPNAIKRTFYLSTQNSEGPGEIQFRAATLNEVCLLKGRLERLEVPYVRRVYPGLADRYVEQARKTLRRRYDKGDDDPAILAELGLLESESGNDAAAAVFLRPAAASKIVHPTVYAELARIIYTQLRREYPDDDVPPGLSSELIELLTHAHAQSPALPGVHELLLEAWLRYRPELSPDEFASLAESVRLFPRHFRIIYAAALLHARQGRVEAARNLVAHGMSVFTAPAEQERLIRLSNSLHPTP